MLSRVGTRVKPAAFAYAKARSIDHAIELLGAPEARLLAGGQSLMAGLNMRLASPSVLIDINDIVGLDRIEFKDGRVEIGAMVRHVQAERSEIIARHAPLIARAMPHIAHVAIRNRGTIGGSLAYADPAAELPACMVALDADFEIAGPKGRRKVRAGDFFKGMFETALGAQDMLVAMSFPAATAQTCIGFEELARRHGDYATVGLAASAKASDQASGKGLHDVRLVYFSVGDAPVRARNAETAIAAGDLEAAVAALAADLSPSADLEASSEVKLHLAGVLLRRVVRQLEGAGA
jgi:carbon-monoxide dehydrogenase medium subunit